MSVANASPTELNESIWRDSFVGHKQATNTICRKLGTQRDSLVGRFWIQSGCLLPFKVLSVSVPVVNCGTQVQSKERRAAQVLHVRSRSQQSRGRFSRRLKSKKQIL